MLNKLILEARLRNDPEIRKTNDGKSVCAFSVLWSDKYRDKETVCFKDCVAWGYTAEFVHKYFSKGSLILLCGKEVTQIWEDKEGKKHYKQKMSVEEAHFCDTKQSSGGNGPQGGSRTAESEGFKEIDEYEDEGNLPF